MTTCTIRRVNGRTIARPRTGMSPLTIAFLACLALAVVAVLYVCASPAVDASALAGR